MKTGDPIVFVVDDDPSMREALIDLLASVGLSVETFKSAPEFLERTRPDAPACLVLMVAPKLFASWGQNSLGSSFGA